jgi:hypothetical protein
MLTIAALLILGMATTFALIEIGEALSASVHNSRFRPALIDGCVGGSDRSERPVVQ